MLALRGERGFGSTSAQCSQGLSIFEETLHRLALVGDSNAVSKSIRKVASHCGGAPPMPPLLLAFKESPMVADPGNAVYGRIVRRLSAKVDDMCAAMQKHNKKPNGCSTSKSSTTNISAIWLKHLWRPRTWKQLHRVERVVRGQRLWVERTEKATV